MIERYRIMKPRNSNNIYLYDEINQDIVIEICTGNKQMNRIMMQACYQLLQVKRNNNPKSGCPIIFCTPAIDYGLTREDFNKIKQRVMEFDIE